MINMLQTSIRKGACVFFVLLAGVVLSGSALTAQESPETGPSLEDGVVAWVNDSIILHSDVMDRIRPRLKQYRKRLSKRELAYRKRTLFMQELSLMVEEKVIIQAAREEGLQVTNRELNQLEQQMVERFESREKFLETLRQNGRTLEDWRRNKRKQELQKKLIRKKFRGAGVDTFVSPREIRKYYQENKEEFFREPRVKGHIITIPTAEVGGEKEAKKLIEETLRQIRTGADMKTLARLHNKTYGENNRTFDWTRRGNFHRDVEKALFEHLEVDEVSDPIVLPDRVVLVKLKGKIKGKQKTFSDPQVQEKIRNRLRSRKLKKHRKKLRKDLFQKAYIKPQFLREQMKGGS